MEWNEYKEAKIVRNKIFTWNRKGKLKNNSEEELKRQEEKTNEKGPRPY